MRKAQFGIYATFLPQFISYLIFYDDQIIIFLLQLKINWFLKIKNKNWKKDLITLLSITFIKRDKKQFGSAKNLTFDSLLKIFSIKKLLRSRRRESARLFRSLSPVD